MTKNQPYQVVTSKIYFEDYILARQKGIKLSSFFRDTLHAYLNDENGGKIRREELIKSIEDRKKEIALLETRYNTILRKEKEQEKENDKARIMKARMMKQMRGGLF